MTGHEPLLRMRRAGRVPACVWVCDGLALRARDWHLERNGADGQFHAELGLAPGDIPEVVDFRCVVGLDVRLSAQRGAVRGRRLHAALIDAGARRVISSIHGEGGIDLLVHEREAANG